MMAGYDYYPYGMPMTGRYVQDANTGNGIVSLQQVTTPIQRGNGLDLSQGWDYYGPVQKVTSTLSATVGFWAGASNGQYGGACGTYGQPDFAGHIHRIIDSLVNANNSS